jgi:hypothetical protein
MSKKRMRSWITSDHPPLGCRRIRARTVAQLVARFLELEIAITG